MATLLDHRHERPQPRRPGLGLPRARRTALRRGVRGGRPRVPSHSLTRSGTPPPCCPGGARAATSRTRAPTLTPPWLVLWDAPHAPSLSATRAAQPPITSPPRCVARANTRAVCVPAAAAAAPTHVHARAQRPARRARPAPRVPRPGRRGLDHACRARAPWARRAARTHVQPGHVRDGPLRVRAERPVGQARRPDEGPDQPRQLHIGGIFKEGCVLNGYSPRSST
jgi:hypothetical protein